MYQEPCLADEVVVILGDGEVVDRFLAWERGDGDDPAPGALHRLYKIAHLHLIRSEPTAVLRVAALDPEGMIDAGPQRRLLAFQPHLKQAGRVERSERRDWLRLKLAGLRIARDHRVTLVDVLDGNVAAAGMHRRAGGKAGWGWFEVSHPFRTKRGKDGTPSAYRRVKGGAPGDPRSRVGGRFIRRLQLAYKCVRQRSCITSRNAHALIPLIRSRDSDL